MITTKRLLVTLLIAGGALVQAGLASAGCWATAGLAPPPKSTEPGDTWAARVMVLQHGRNPLPDAADARPTVTIRNAATGERATFTAHPAGEPGVYEAAVVFPSAGSWRYEVFDDFTTWNGEPAPCAQSHTFAAVEIGSTGSRAGGNPGGGSGVPLWPILGGSLALAALLAAAAAWTRRRARRGYGTILSKG